MNRALIFVLVFGWTTASWNHQAFASDTGSTVVKNCLAAIYNVQLSFHQASGSYIGETPRLIEALDLKKAPGRYCKDLTLNVLQSGHEKFLVEARSKGASGTVDETKTIHLPSSFAQNRIQKGELRLTQITAGSLYEKLGLKTGDILKTYNGKPFESDADLEALAHQFQTPGILKLKIVRDGKLKELSYTVK